MNVMIVCMVLNQVQTSVSFMIMKKHIQHILSHIHASLAFINVSNNTESNATAVFDLRRFPHVHIHAQYSVLRITCAGHVLGSRF